MRYIVREKFKTQNLQQRTQQLKEMTARYLRSLEERVQTGAEQDSADEGDEAQ